MKRWQGKDRSEPFLTLKNIKLLTSRQVFLRQICAYIIHISTDFENTKDIGHLKWARTAQEVIFRFVLNSQQRMK